ncbi:hypothetical protein [Acinetobacter gerneri]|uniref:Uncharacterized protein n=2 Tax=Acinetobacter gerneri TaxID=202952 RepID=N8ZLK8_9GAMM|nr:hypothetical protein [Acinetobacter gerneri]ENV32658.1 hypothetical protein F960_03165 [Acinetobacter gerneri DSM 14967 = CIP 107464 = MTCC 9824]EPR84566.1 hypothetical protein L289_1321 [Acinetobacter gerneri DSM 14967 = CIP 107464 = MTCC 9824]MDQ9010136.1 hypothetical protein [Acinetobacter gerneri]MDQ9014259.1 hypothetical protein [Acinetobacter gerneri]MDQ9025414.1 hypothetical protein [Acinetobacter gerneri]
MKLQQNISKTLIYSFLFAVGGCPTIAMWIVSGQTDDQDILISAFMSVTILLACIILPIILIQNVFILIKKNSVALEDKIKPLAILYLVLNILCLVYWLMYYFKLI